MGDSQMWEERADAKHPKSWMLYINVMFSLDIQQNIEIFILGERDQEMLLFQSCNFPPYH